VRIARALPESANSTQVLPECSDKLSKGGRNNEQRRHCVHRIDSTGGEFPLYIWIAGRTTTAIKEQEEVERADFGIERQAKQRKRLAARPMPTTGSATYDVLFARRRLLRASARQSFLEENDRNGRRPRQP
jgi:hypothetical protein